MDPSLSFQITVWVWIIIGVATVVGAAAFVFSEDGGEIGEPWPVPVFLGLGLGGGGLLTLSLAAAGWPSIALYVWRGTAIFVTLLGVVIFLRNRRSTFPGPPGFKPAITSSGVRWSAAIATLLLGGLTSLSFQRHSLPKSAELIVSSVGETTQGQLTLSLSSVIWIGALILLAVGTLVFLVLFAQRLRSGGAPKLETHWEGIGGGLGGWRMSSSLGYLLVAGVFALLFTVFLFHFDARERERELAAIASPTPRVVPIELPSPTVVPKESPTPRVAPTELPRPVAVPKESPAPEVGPR